MKEYLQQLIEGGGNAIARNGLAREYLQARVLESLQDGGAFMRWAFVGGTALRFLFSIPRFSEDLDFSLLREGHDPAFKPALEAVKHTLAREGYPVEITVNESRTVLSAWLRYHTNFWILAVLATGSIALVVSSYVLEARAGHHGATSEVAAIIVFILGALIFHEFYAVAIACSVVLTLFLSLKQPLQRLVAHVSEEDIYATLKFAIITAIVLPVLPNQTMGPLDVINPRQVWYMVILIAGISFAGYVLVKVFGSKRGLVITGLLGGLVSSTAVTLSFSQRSREIPDLSRTFASAIILACTIMYPRVLIEIAVVNPALLALMWPYLGCLHVRPILM